jgi:hypothetical protein
MARDAVYSIDMRVPPGTKATIVQFGINDRYLLRAPAGDIARSLEEIIRRVHAKGSAVILVRQWPASDAAILQRRNRAWTPSSPGIPTFITKVGRAAGGGSVLNTIQAITRT